MWLIRRKMSQSMKNQTCIWSEALKGPEGKDFRGAWICTPETPRQGQRPKTAEKQHVNGSNMQHPLPPRWQPLWCQWSKMEDWAAQDVRQLTRSGIVQVSIWAKSDSLEVFIVRTWMRFLLRASLRNHMCLWGWGRGQQLADVLLIEQHNRPDSVNQHYRRNKFRLTAHFL